MAVLKAEKTMLASDVTDLLCLRCSMLMISTTIVRKGKKKLSGMSMSIARLITLKIEKYMPDYRGLRRK